MSAVIESWSFSDATRLSHLWCESTADAPYCYVADPTAFAHGILSDESDDESLATNQGQQLMVALSGRNPVAFAHLAAGHTEIDANSVACGIIRYFSFLPEFSSVAQALLSRVEQVLTDEGHVHLDAFPLYHGYAFHNHKVGILSDRLEHVTDLFTRAGYTPHDAHLTLERPLEAESRPEPHPDVVIEIERTRGAGIRPDIRTNALLDGRAIGGCRSTSSRRYAESPELEGCAYTRWLGVDREHRTRGIGRHLLQRAIYEMAEDGYSQAVLNCRHVNLPAVSLYQSLGYSTGDVSSAYVKDLGA